MLAKVTVQALEIILQNTPAYAVNDKMVGGEVKQALAVGSSIKVTDMEQWAVDKGKMPLPAGQKGEHTLVIPATDITAIQHATTRSVAVVLEGNLT